MQEEGEKFLVCGRCKVLAYCSKACQKQHWRGGHKDTCQAPSEREDTVKKAANKTVDDGDKPSKASAKKTANKTVDEDPEKPWKASAKKPNKPSSTSSGGAAAAEEEQNQKPSSRRATARVDATTGAPLSFGKDDNCAICLDTMRNPIRLPSCGHWYCKECVDRLRQAASAQDVCPVCREPLPPGPEKLFDEAVTKYLRVKRVVERLGVGWSNLSWELQLEMDEVHELFEQAADQGHAVAQYNLGCMYHEGQGVAQDFTKAREWFELAAAQGNAQAQYNLAQMYRKGQGGG